MLNVENRTLKNSYLVFFFLLPTICFSQLEVVSILREPPPSKTSASARTSSLTAMPLPFWDDFSFNVKSGYPNDTLWEADSKSVWVNNGNGINPPSIYVATFDGNNLLGKPYSPDPQTKGNADVMTSRPLKLGDVAQANRASVFMSFFFQFGGNGDAPEAGDILSLLFKNDKGQWIEVWSQTKDGTLLKDKFNEVSPLNIQALEKGEHNFFHNDFQFRFQAFGRLSGPYDVWNVDYVYLSNGKPKILPLLGYEDFPDRTVTSPLSSLLNNYWAIPAQHFFTNIGNNLSTQKVIVSSQRKDQKPPKSPGEVADYNSSILIFSKETGIATKTILENEKSIGNLPYNNPKTVFTSNVKLPDLTQYQNSDSISLTFSFDFNSKDNIIKLASNFNDWDTTVYKEINFKSNDTVRSQNILSNYYAYDDGVAEYGLRTIGKDTELAYQFDMKTTAKDNIIAFDIYFPKYSDTTVQTITLFVAKSLTGSLSDYLYQQSYAVKRTNNNKFSRFKIPIGVEVQNQFYIGWKLNSEKIIPVGLDRNNDSGTNIFSKVAGSEVWVQNTSVYGSIMLRPVFGIPDNTTTSVEKRNSSEVYPNPSHGVFYIPIQSEQVQLYDLAGRPLEFQETTELKNKQIKILNPTTGLFLVRYFNRQWRTEKIMIKP
jgi:hypothetical protein